MIDERTFLFIIGAPRSGTTWLQLMLGDHPAVVTTVELNLFSDYIPAWVDIWTSEHNTAHKVDQGLSFLWSDEEFQSFIRLFLERAYSKVLARKPDATHILDKRPLYADYVDYIRLYFPNARYIHIIRDGRDVAASLLAAKREMNFGSTDVHHAANVWKTRVLNARKAAESNEGNYLELRYEAMLDDPQGELKRVLEFCQVSATDQQIMEIVEANKISTLRSTQKGAQPDAYVPKAHYRKGIAGTWQTELTTQQKYTFQQTAGDLLNELGYTVDPNWWIEQPNDRILLPAIAQARRYVGKVRRAIKKRL